MIYKRNTTKKMVTKSMTLVDITKVYLLNLLKFIDSVVVFRFLIVFFFLLGKLKF
jgi:hypothetical protein